MEYETNITWQGEERTVIIELSWGTEAITLDDGSTVDLYDWQIVSVLDTMGEVTFTNDDFKAVHALLDPETISDVINSWVND